MAHNVSTTSQGMLTAEKIRQLYKARTADGRSVRSEVEPLSSAAQYVVRETKKRIHSSIHDLSSVELIDVMQQVENEEREVLSERERVAAVRALQSSLDHYDLLTPLIENKAVNDILISRYDDISVQIGRKNIQTDLRFGSRDTYKAFIEQVLKRAGKACTLATPVVDASIDPHIRMCVTHESFSPRGEGPFVTIRIARQEALSAEGVLSSGMAPVVIFEYLSAIVRSGSATVLISGEVGTGKTTLLRTLAQKIDPQEAVLVIEDTHEIMLERPFTRTLLIREANTEGAGKISHAEAIRAGMRMAMNRVLLGEMRDAAAAEAFIDVSASGHPGLSTIHARSARDTINRLELFLLRAQQGVGVDVVRRLIANSVSVIVFLSLDPIARRRRVQQVVEIATSADGQVQLSPIFTFTRLANRAVWMRDSGLTQFAETLRESGVTLPTVGYELHEEGIANDTTDS